jgi:hypothetical protein
VPEQVFFVSGSAKSGTTWMQLLLDEHPRVSCLGEAFFAAKLIPNLANAFDDYTKFLASKNSEGIGERQGYPLPEYEDQLFSIRMVVDFLLHKNAAQSGKRDLAAIGEKTPDNIRSLRTLSQLFPEAKHLIMVRDGRDIVISAWFHNKRVAEKFSSTAQSESHPSKEFITLAAQAWAVEQQAAVDFAEQNPGKVHFIRYSDLVSACAEQLTGVFDFLGVPAAQDDIDTCIRNCSFEALSGGRIRGEENAKSFFRKGIDGDWQNYFRREDNDLFLGIAGDWLEKFKLI